MTQEREYYNNLREMRNGKIREDKEYTGASLLTGCAVALFMTAALLSSIWYACRVIFD